MDNLASELRDKLLTACQSSYAPNIIRARDEILSLPREYVLNNISTIATESLNLADEWEFRRLLELYQLLDNELLQGLINIGIASGNEELKEAACDFKAKMLADDTL